MFILFIPKAYRENEFTEYCKNIRIEAEQEKSDTFNTSNQNFISILLANKKYLTDLEIQDEVSTMILSVSSESRSLRGFDQLKTFREMPRLLSRCHQPC